MLEWKLAVTESGKKSHLTETDAYTFCAPFWGQVTDSIDYDGQTSFRGKPLCKNCKKWGLSKASNEIALQKGDPDNELWILYQAANGQYRVTGRGQKAAADPDPKGERKPLPANVSKFPRSASA